MGGIIKDLYQGDSNTGRVFSYAEINEDGTAMRVGHPPSLVRDDGVILVGPLFYSEWENPGHYKHYPIAYIQNNRILNYDAIKSNG